MQILKLTISTSVDLLSRSKGYFFKILTDKLFLFGKNEEYASESWFRCIVWQQPTILFSNLKTFTKNRINQRKSGKKITQNSKKLNELSSNNNQITFYRVVTHER